jgi:flagellar protein FliO/FliZ
MDVIRPEQMAIVTGFLGALGILWFLVQRNRTVLARHVSGSARMRVAEAVPVGPGDRALILAVDDREFLILRVQGAAPVVLPLPASVPGGPA